MLVRLTKCVALKEPIRTRCTVPILRHGSVFFFLYGAQCPYAANLAISIDTVYLVSGYLPSLTVCLTTCLAASLTAGLATSFNC